MVRTEDPGMPILDIFSNEDEEIYGIQVNQVSDTKDNAVGPYNVKVTVPDEGVTIQSFLDTSLVMDIMDNGRVVIMVHVVIHSG